MKQLTKTTHQWLGDTVANQYGPGLDGWDSYNETCRKCGMKRHRKGISTFSYERDGKKCKFQPCVVMSTFDQRVVELFNQGYSHRMICRIIRNESGDDPYSGPNVNSVRGAIRKLRQHGLI